MRAFLFLMVLVATAAVSRADDNTAPAANDSPKAEAAVEGAAPAAEPKAEEKKAEEKKAEEKKAEEKKAEESPAEPKKDEKKSEEPGPDAKKDTAAVTEVKPAEAPSAPAAQPMPETAPLEKPEAAPANPPASPKAEAEQNGGTPAADGKDGKAEEKKADAEESHLGLHWGIGASLFVGAQSDADTNGGYFGLSPSLSYGVSKMTTLSAGLSPFINFKLGGQYGIPDSNRRIDNNPAFSALRASFRDLYVEEATGIHLSGSVTYSLPLSYNNLALSTNPTIGDLGAGVSLSRKFGAFSLSLNGLAKVFGYLQATPYYDCEKEPSRCERSQSTGHWNPRNAYIGSLAGNYSYGAWSASASFGLSHTQKYGVGEATEQPNNLNDHANDSYGFSLFASVAYQINDHLGVNGGLFNGGPQLTSIEGYNNFIFDKKFAGFFIGTDWSN